MLLGRDGELAVIHAGAVAAAAEVRGPPAVPGRAVAASVVEIVGVAGIGKSALLDAAAEQLAESGFGVLRHGPTAPERSLPWGTLIALVEQLDRTAHAALAASHRRHLAAVFGHNDTTAEPLPHGVAVAVRELLTITAGSQPLALLIDDAQWVDAPSAAVISFAARGLERHRALLVLARRDSEPPVIAPFAPAGDCRHLELGGLEIDAVAELVRATTGQRFHRQLLMELYECSGGHPQFVIEMASELAAGVDRRDALRRRVTSDAPAALLESLPDETNTVLEHAALTSRPTVRHLGAAIGRDDVLAALGPAEVAQLVRIVHDGEDVLVRFDPSSMAAACEQRMSTARRRDTHLRLAAAAVEPIQRAVHLAAAPVAPAADAAADIESGARLAQRRGDFATAVRLAEAAVAATPPDSSVDLRRRLLALAEAQGYARMAPELLATLDRVEVVPHSDEAGAVVVMRTPALAEVHGLDVASEHVRAASSWVIGPSRAQVFRQLNAMDRMRDLRLGAETAARSLQAARADGSPAWIATATVAKLAGQAAIGESTDIDAAIAVAASPHADRHTRNELLHLLWYTGDPRGIEWTERVIEIAGDAGDAVYELNARTIQANLLVPRGEWQRAEEMLWQVLRHGYPDASERALLGFLLAATGRIDEADAMWGEIVSAERTRGRTNVAQVHVWRAMGGWASGADDAVDLLVEADELARSIGLGAPRPIAFRRDLVEALVAAGRIDDARTAAARLRADADRNGMANSGADADVAEALLAGDDGDGDRAAELIARAIKVHEQHGERYELARSLLTSGRLARRFGRRRAARGALESAIALFDSFGAAPWTTRSTAELQMVSGRSPRRNATLTDTERLIAEQAAAGKSNAEIAAATFVARRTVEANLSRVYRKLGIRKRAQLAASLAAASNAGALVNPVNRRS